MILVVGGGGYVGSVLCEELVNRGFKVRVLDSFLFGDGGLSGIRDRIDCVRGDMRTTSDSVFEHVRAVVNLAGFSNDPMANKHPKLNEELNYRAAAQFAHRAKAAGVERYVYASTCSVYDRGCDDESADVCLTEESKVAPESYYASSKRLAELALLPISDEGFAVTCLRKGTIYGYSDRMR